MRNFIPAGMPYCAGYACGYYLVKYYIENTGKSVVEATIMDAKEILRDSIKYWDEVTVI